MLLISSGAVFSKAVFPRMSIWTFVKLLAALAVLGVMGFTGMLAYHIMVKPQGGVFEKIIPNPQKLAHKEQPADFTKMLDSAEMPDLDPGEKVYQKAHELIAMGKIAEARERLNSLISTFPSSPSAPEARRIIGQMNLDEVLCTANQPSKKTYVVVRGDSPLKIANKFNTTLEAILYYNGMMEFGGLQPGEELTVVPLEYRILIEPQRKMLSLWDGSRFICEYPIAHMGTSALVAGKTIIDSKYGFADGKKVTPNEKKYRTSDKAIHLQKPSMQIRAFDQEDPDRGGGIFLFPADMEELSLLTRTGNEVEIRKPAR